MKRDVGYTTGMQYPTDDNLEFSDTNSMNFDVKGLRSDLDEDNNSSEVSKMVVPALVPRRSRIYKGKMLERYLDNLYNCPEEHWS